MTRRQRVIGSTLLVLLLVLIATVFWAHRAWQGFLQAQGMNQLDWQGLSLAATELQLEQVGLTQVRNQGSVRVKARGVVLNWRWRGLKPRIHRLSLEQLNLNRDDAAGTLELGAHNLSLAGEWPGFSPAFDRLNLEQLDLAWQTSAGADSAGPDFSTASLPHRLPDWLPRQTTIERFSAQLPCASGSCPLSGDLHLRLQPQSGRQTSLLESLSGRAELHVQLAEPWPVPAPYKASLEGQLGLSLQLDRGQWQGRVSDTWLSVRMPRFTRAGWQFQDTRAKLVLSGEAGEGQARLSLEQGSNLKLGQVASVAGAGAEADPNLQLQEVALNLRGLQVSADYNDSYAPGEGSWAGFLSNMSAQGPLELALGELQAPYLQSQAWNFSGSLDAEVTRAQVTGRLRNRAEAGLDLSLDYAFGGELLAEARLISQGDSGARSLAQTFPDWPEDLVISDGRFNAQARLRVSPAGEPAVEGQLQFDALSGIYDRTAWSGLTGLVNFSLQGEQWLAQAPELRLNRINPGISAGPLELAGQYQVNFAQPMGGRLTLDQARLQWFGGELWLEPGSWQLTDMPLRFPLKFKHLELAQLMQAYPTEGLAGTGRLNGDLPVLIDKEGVSLTQGQVRALEPGGTLELPADSVRALSQANQTTQLVARALQNFHYTVLTSRIDYTQDGTLLLGLHLQGKSPNIPDGRPVVLNINLEEDLAALLTSLQLSGRVNEAVTKKVQEMIRQQEQTP